MSNFKTLRGLFIFGPLVFQLEDSDNDFFSYLLKGKDLDFKMSYSKKESRWMGFCDLSSKVAIALNKGWSDHLIIGHEGSPNNALFVQGYTKTVRLKSLIGNCRVSINPFTGDVLIFNSHADAFRWLRSLK